MYIINCNVYGNTEGHEVIGRKFEDDCNSPNITQITENPAGTQKRIYHKRKFTAYHNVETFANPTYKIDENTYTTRYGSIILVMRGGDTYVYDKEGYAALSNATANSVRKPKHNNSNNTTE